MNQLPLFAAPTEGAGPDTAAEPVPAPLNPPNAPDGTYRAYTAANGETLIAAFAGALDSYTRAHGAATLLLVNVQDTARYPPVPGLRVQVAAYIDRGVWGLGDDPTVRR